MLELVLKLVGIAMLSYGFRTGNLDSVDDGLALIGLAFSVEYFINRIRQSAKAGA